MDCRDAHPLISIYLDGEASDADRARVEEHIGTCTDCRARVDRWRRNDAVVREGLRPAQPAADLADRIVQRVGQPPITGIRWGRWVVRLAAAALMMFTVTDVILRRQIYATPDGPEQDFMLVASAEAAAGGRTSVTVQLRAIREQVGVEGSKVTLVLRRAGSADETKLAEGVTREDGSCPLSAAVPPEAEGDYEVVARVLGPKGAEEVRRRVTIKREFKVFVTTDKPLYQPAQVIHIRAMVLASNDLAPAQELPVLLEVFDSKENKVFKKSFPTSKFGIVSADFELADEVLTGVYRVKATAGRTSSEARVEVKRYVLPKFRVKVETERSWYLPGETVKGSVRADYFFGKTVEGGKVELAYSTFAGEEVKLGTWDGKTDASGTARFELTLPQAFHGIDLLRGDAPLLLRVKVTDAAEHPQEANTSLTVARDAIRIVLVPESGRLVAGVENILYVLTTYPDGRPAQCEVTLEPGLPFVILGNLHEVRKSSYVTTDETGLAQVTVAPPSSGLNLESVKAKDAAGNETTLSGHALSEALGSLEPQSSGFLLRPDKAIYRAGDTMKLALLAPSMPGNYYVDLVRENRTLLTATVQVSGAAGALEVDLPLEAFGAIQVHAYHVMPSGQVVRDTRIVLVDPPAGLGISAKLDKETYRPGERAQIEFRVTNSAGAGVPSAVGLSIVDESLFALAETKPGLERVYAAIEEDILKPRYQIKSCPYTPGSFAIPEARPQGPEPRIQALATVSLAAAGVDLDVASVERSAPTRQTQLRQERQVLNSRLKDVENFGVAALFVMAGLVLFLLFPILVLGKLLRGAPVPITTVAIVMIAFLAGSVVGPSSDFRVGSALVFILAWISIMIAGIAKRTNGIACSLAVSIVLVVGFAAMLLPALSSARKSAASRSLDTGSVMAPQSEALGGPGFDNQSRSHALRSFSTEQALNVGLPGKRRTEPPRLRQWFPETLFWAPQVLTDETGRAVVDVPNVADSITTWRIVASAVSARGEMGGMTGGLRVFQDFFVDPDLPVALTQGDRVELPVAVYNWLTEPQEVELTLAASDGFSLLDSKPKKTVRMEASSVGVVRFPIRVERIGGWKVRVDAKGSKGLADAIQRTIQVLPDGKEMPFGASDRLEASARRTVPIPENAVPGASVLLVKLLPGTFAEVKDGLEGMLALPYG